MRFRVTKVDVQRDLLDAAAASSDTRAALLARAAALLPRAVSIAQSSGAKEFARSLRVETGTRPGSHSSEHVRRPFARVIATSADATAREYGDVNVDKQAIMRRAVGG